jgi:transketolase
MRSKGHRRRQHQGRNHRHAQGLADFHQRPGPGLPEFLGGSADLTGSNLTNWTGCKPVSGKGGNYISYGVREFGMAAIMNGMALHGGLLPFGGTFLMFSEYARNALRMAALMKQRVIYRVHPRFDRPRRRRPDPPAGGTDRDAAHDPQHGRLASLRHGRNHGGLGSAVEKLTGPTSLCLSRQNLPFVLAMRRPSPTSRAAAT